MDFKDTLKAFAEKKNWRFVYARRDYQNLVDVSQFIADQMEGYGVGETMLMVDPIVRQSTADGKQFSGSFMILTKSDHDDDYDSRYDKYIEPLISILFEEFSNAALCDYDIDELRSVEVINQFDWNADGLAITYRVRNYE